VRVVVNRLAALGHRTGVGHYTAELLRCLQQLRGDEHIDCFPSGCLWRLCQLWARVHRGPGTTSTAGAGPGRASLGALLSRPLVSAARALGRRLTARNLRAAFGGGRCDLYHEPNGIPLPCDCRTLLTLHDLSVLLHPEWHPASRVRYYETHFARGLAQAQHFLTGSDFTRQELIHTLNLRPERVTRVYHGIRPGLMPLPPEEVGTVLRRLGLPPAYLLHVGTVEPRKNLGMLLRAYCAMPEHLRRAWPLLLVGPWGWNADNIREYYQREARHRGVIHLGYVADRHLAAVYNAARALVYPSLYEGFGLPPLEMMACGGAVLASTAGPLAELLGERAHLMDPHDIDGWRAAMVRVVRDHSWWRELRSGVVQRARPFTWERCALETLRLYRSLCGKSPSHVEPLAA
jgi:alpha-1,3-rhamnosyl/mannosyltransferase